MERGGLCRGQVERDLAVRGGVGYTALDPQSTLSLGSRQEGPYARIGFAHRLNQDLDHGLTLSRDISFSPYGGLMNDYLVAWSGNWHTLRKITFSTSFVYQHGSQAAYGAETYDWLSPRLFISRPVSQAYRQSRLQLLPPHVHAGPKPIQRRPGELESGIPVLSAAALGISWL